MKQHFDVINYSNLTSHRVPQSLPYSVFFSAKYCYQSTQRIKQILDFNCFFFVWYVITVLGCFLFHPFDRGHIIYFIILIWYINNFHAYITLSMLFVICAFRANNLGKNKTNFPLNQNSFNTSPKKKLVLRNSLFTALCVGNGNCADFRPLVPNMLSLYQTVN